MKRKISFGASLVIALMAAIITYQITVISEQTKYNEKLSEILISPQQNPKIQEVIEFTENNFIKEIDSEYLTDATIFGYVLGLDDPYAAYYTKDQYQEVLTPLQGNMTGIGIRLFLNRETSVATIYEVMTNSPAEKAGVMAGDVIHSINGIPYKDLQYEGAVNEMLGEVDTELEFEVKREGKIVKFNLTRTLFESQTVSYKICNTDNQIGYVRIYSFNDATPAQFKNAVETLLEQGAVSLIFDVRNNPGGKLESVAEILDYLLPEGPIIRMITKNQETHVLNSDAAELLAPMVVLANSSSASAAELFTSALMDYNKATFIGTKTYGKGTVQSNHMLSDGSAIKISTAYYLPPYSESFNEIGIEPDINVELSETSLINFYLLTETEDEQLFAAINYLKK